MNQVDTARGRKPGKAGKKLQLERRVNLRELAITTRQFSTLLSSGVHLSEALTALVEQVGDAKFEIVFRDVREKIVGGTGLADALSYHPHYFSDLYVNMVRAGEASGSLDEVLNRLADYLQAQASLRGKVAAALTYPAIMVVVGVGVVVFLMSYVVPKITEILLEKDNVLPLPTVILIHVSEFMKTFWWVILLGVLAAIVGLRLVLATEKGRLAFDTTMLQVPVIGNLFKKQAISRFAVTFSTLLKSGLPALESLTIVAQVVNNARLALIIGEVRDRILEGADIATPIKRSKVFPPMIGYMVAVGEQSGQLEDILDRIADSYEEEIDLAVQRMTAMVEPVIIIFLAVVVGFIIMAVLLPLLQFNDI